MIIYGLLFDLFVVDRLNIYGEPIVREFHSLLRAVEGQPFTLHCPWAGYPMEKVGWEKGERQRHFPSSLLVILSANHVTMLHPNKVSPPQDISTYTLKLVVHLQRTRLQP